MIQVPDAFLRAVVDFPLPAAPGSTRPAWSSCRPTARRRPARSRVLEKYALVEGAEVLGWRDVPVNPTGLGATALAALPRIRQVFLAAHRLTARRTAGEPLAGLELERVAFCVRKQTERETASAAWPRTSRRCPSRTIVYKGMLTPDQVPAFFPDLTDERVVSAIALVHSRFSTNTFPSWPLAHPYRFIAHNGEINTIRGNQNWMSAREALLAARRIPGDLRRLFPICTPDASDSANFDEVLELLHLAGRSLPHAVLMMIPEAWENDPTMDPARRAFYRFHASLMEPWDGPASVAFTDGTRGRRGARPQRPAPRPLVAHRATAWSCWPARRACSTSTRRRSWPRAGCSRAGCSWSTPRAGRIVEDDEIKAELAAAAAVRRVAARRPDDLDDLPDREHIVYTHDSVQRRQQTFGYTEEELKILLAPMARGRRRAARLDGHRHADLAAVDPAAAALRLLPPALRAGHQPAAGRDPRGAGHQPVARPSARRATCSTRARPAAGRSCCRTRSSTTTSWPRSCPSTTTATCPASRRCGSPACTRCATARTGSRRRLTEICRHVSEAIEDGVRILVLSDRDSTADLAPIPSLLLTAAVHQHLVREQTRTQVALIVESGDCREVHHVAVLHRVRRGGGQPVPGLRVASRT